MIILLLHFDGMNTDGYLNDLGEAGAVSGELKNDPCTWGVLGPPAVATLPSAHHSFVLHIFSARFVA
jgi:hypothetical protein